MTADLTGQRFGRLVVIAQADVSGGHRMWEVLCDCGTMRAQREGQLIKRNRSCGCGGGRPRSGYTPDRGYQRAHAQMRRRYGRASQWPCVDCASMAEAWSYIGGCPDEKRNSKGHPFCEGHASHYQPRCRFCHNVLDRSPWASARRLRAQALGSI
jgi:hypothetical protein